MSTEREDFVFGRKTLSLDIDLDRNTASVRIGTREPSLLHPKRPKETTTIFQMADQSLIDWSKKLQQPIVLRFDTSNTNLKHWIISKKELLQFDDVQPLDQEAYHMFVQKTYVP